MESPPNGHNRYYTYGLWEFNVPLNHFVYNPTGVLGENLTYDDVACSGTCSSSSGGNNSGCNTAYQSPTPNDAQLDGLCQAAYTYRCGGYDSQADLTCAQYAQLAATGTNVPPCPYCQ